MFRDRRKVVERAGRQVVNTDDGVACCKQRLNQMTANEVAVLGYQEVCHRWAKGCDEIVQAPHEPSRAQHHFVDDFGHCTARSGSCRVAGQRGLRWAGWNKV